MAAILDSHPEIIISDEFNLLYKFDSFFMDPSQTNDERKLRIFYDIHTRSRGQAMFGSRSSICNSSVSYCYNIKGGWQGDCKSKLKVRDIWKGPCTEKNRIRKSKLQSLGVLFMLVVMNKQFKSYKSPTRIKQSAYSGYLEKSK